MVEMKTSPVVVTISHLEDKYTDILTVHEITKGVFVAPRQKSKNTQQHSINTSTGAITIVTIMKRKNPDGVGQTEKW